MTYHRACRSNATGVAIGAHEFNTVFIVSRSVPFCVLFCGSFCLFVFFLLTIVSSVILWLMAFVYHVGYLQAFFLGLTDFSKLREILSIVVNIPFSYCKNNCLLVTFQQYQCMTFAYHNSNIILRFEPFRVIFWRATQTRLLYI
jgi:hypothetical protein